MDDIEALCDRIMVIGRGQIMHDGSLRSLRAKVNNERRLIVDLRDAATPVDEADARVIERQGERVVLAFDPDTVSPAALITRIASHYDVRDLVVEHPPIERIIAELYAQHDEVEA
jgi:ABC-2 type transport system ATP-binding protein